MQTLKSAIEKATKHPAQPSITRTNNSEIVRNLKNPSPHFIENGVNALDLIGGRVADDTLTDAKYLIEQNYGTEYSDRKWIMLAQMIVDDGWTEERFKQTFKWFLKNKRFSAWTIADWFDFGVKLYPIEWMKREIAKMGNPEGAWKKFDRYRVNGVVLCKLKDGVELPLEKIE